MNQGIDFKLICLFIFIIFSWGLGWPASKIGLDYLSPLWYTALRMVVGTVTMMGIVIAANKFALPKRQDFPLIITIGLLQICAYILLANIGLSYLPAGRSSFIAYTTPLWIMPITILFFNEQAGWLRWLGFALGIGGLILLVNPWQMNWNDKNTLIGTGVLLLASFSWAISMLCTRYMHWTKSPLELAPWQLLVGTLPIVFFALTKEPLPAIHWNPPLILSLCYTGILVTGLSYWSGVVLNKSLPTIVVSLGFLIVPVLSLLISSYFMHEVISTETAFAMGLILVGLVCLVFEPAREQTLES